MRRVVAIQNNGEAIIREEDSKEITHEEMICEMFKEILEPLEGEKVEGDLINIWPHAGILSKHFDMMLYLETLNDDAIINHPVCIIPKSIDETQLNYYEENYLNSDDTFISLDYDGERFNLIGNSYLDSNELHQKLKDKSNYMNKKI